MCYARQFRIMLFFTKHFEALMAVLLLMLLVAEAGRIKFSNSKQGWRKHNRKVREHRKEMNKKEALPISVSHLCTPLEFALSKMVRVCVRLEV